MFLWHNHNLARNYKLLRETSLTPMTMKLILIKSKRRLSKTISRVLHKNLKISMKSRKKLLTQAVLLLNSLKKKNWLRVRRRLSKTLSSQRKHWVTISSMWRNLSPLSKHNQMVLLKMSWKKFCQMPKSMSTISKPISSKERNSKKKRRMPSKRLRLRLPLPTSAMLRQLRI